MIVELRRPTLWAERLRTLGLSFLVAAYVAPSSLSGFAIGLACQKDGPRAADSYCGVQLPFDATSIEPLLLGGGYLGAIVVWMLCRAAMYPWLPVRDFIMSRTTLAARLLAFSGIALVPSVISWFIFAGLPRQIQFLNVAMVTLGPLAVACFSIGETLVTGSIKRALAKVGADASIEPTLYDASGRNYPYGRPKYVLGPIALGLLVLALPLALYFVLEDPWWVYAVYGERSNALEGSIGLVLSLAVPTAMVIMAMVALSLARPDAGEFVDKPDAWLVPLFRSFADDAGLISRKRELTESTLRELASTQGVFVAIGDPKESLPKLGAFRTYTSDEDWQAMFGRLVERSKLIFILAGTTHWVGWEINELKSRGLLRRAIFCFPKRAANEETKTIELISNMTETPKDRLTTASMAPLYLSFDQDRSPVAIVAEKKTKLAFGLGGRIALLSQNLRLGGAGHLLI